MEKTWEEKLLSGEELTQEELYYFAVEVDDSEWLSEEFYGEGAVLRTGVIEVSGRFFALEWVFRPYEGCEYNNQPYEVEKVSKMVEKIFWKPLKRR